MLAEMELLGLIDADGEILADTELRGEILADGLVLEDFHYERVRWNLMDLVMRSHY